MERGLISDKIEKIKLQNNNFTMGLTIPRQIDKFCFLYSFATKSHRKELQEYYMSNIFGLIDIGDYFYKSVYNIYSEYNTRHILPKLNQLTSRASEPGIHPLLKLVVNNSK